MGLTPIMQAYETETDNTKNKYNNWQADMTSLKPHEKTKITTLGQVTATREKDNGNQLGWREHSDKNNNYGAQTQRKHNGTEGKSNHRTVDQNINRITAKQSEKTAHTTITAFICKNTNPNDQERTRAKREIDKSEHHNAHNNYGSNTTQTQTHTNTYLCVHAKTEDENHVQSVEDFVKHIIGVKTSGICCVGQPVPTHANTHR